MKKFFLNIVYFLLPMLVLSYPLDLLLSNTLKKISDFPAEFEVWNDIYDGNLQCDLAIYGSSRAWVHFNSKILEDSLNIPVYNFGFDGYNFWMQHLRHLEYLKHNSPPKHIVLSVDIYSFQRRSDLYAISQFLPYILWNKNFTDYTKTFTGFNSFDYYLPLTRYQGRFGDVLPVFTNLFRSSSEKYRYKGYRGMDAGWNSNLEKAKAEMEYYTVVFDSATIKLFQQFMEECKNLGIGLTLVYSPEYIDGQKFVMNRQEIIDLCNKLTENSNVVFIDYSDSELCYKKDFFYNALHLNSKGADRFTRMFVNDIRNVLER